MAFRAGRESTGSHISKVMSKRAVIETRDTQSCDLDWLVSIVAAYHAGKVSSYVASRAGWDSIGSHISEVMSKRAASETQDMNLTTRTDLTGFTGKSCMAGTRLQGIMAYGRCSHTE